MRYARILSIGLVATVAFAWSAAAVEDAHELAGYCQSLEHGAKGAGRHIYIPRSRDGCECERPCSDPLGVRTLERALTSSPTESSPSESSNLARQESAIAISCAKARSRNY